MPWEKPVPHHKWADELDAEAKTKKALKDAKRDAKNEDHSKVCPFCECTTVKHLQHAGLPPDHPEQRIDTYLCSGCDRLYRVNCPGTILLAGNPTIVQYPGQ